MIDKIGKVGYNENMQTNVQLKKHNTLKIFEVFRQKELVSRKELAENTGLSWGSVSAITGELLQKGVILAEKQASAGGRPADKLALNPYKFLQLGIDINSVGLNFVIVNLKGDVIQSAVLPIESRAKHSLLSALYAQTEKILSSNENVIAINLSMQGKIDRETGVSLRTNFFEDWKDVPLVALFEEKFSLPTKLYHDPDCLLYYHLQRNPGLLGKSNGIVIRIDDGIGMSRLVDGNLYVPRPDTSCELGHTIAEREGRLCACGKQGCLETYASLRGMRDIYAERTGKDDFMEGVYSGDETAEDILKKAAEYLGVAIANLFTLSAPEFILLDGILCSQIPSFFDRIKKNTVAQLKDECELLFASYKPESPAIGACLITAEKNAEEILFSL